MPVRMVELDELVEALLRVGLAALLAEDLVRRRCDARVRQYRPDGRRAGTCAVIVGGCIGVSGTRRPRSCARAGGSFAEM